MSDFRSRMIKKLVLFTKKRTRKRTDKKKGGVAKVLHLIL